jgi:HK97 family phage prohead protease
MPWHIETDNPDCAGGFAVVKDSDGEVVGCHQDEASAQDQITALNIAEAEDRGPNGVDLTVNEATQSAAARGLRLHEDGKSGDGLVAATVRDAVKMARGEELSEDKVRRMPAWFARHEGDWTPGTDDQAGEETPGFVAWLLWGGDPGREWAERKVLELDRAAEDAQEAADAGQTEEPRQMIERDLPDNYRLALEDDVPAGRACGNCGYYDESDRVDDMARCSKWDEYVRGDYYCNAWQPKGEAGEAPDDLEDVQEELAAPAAAVIERAAPLARAEWRESGAGPENKTIRGYAAMFDSMSHDLGGFREVIAPGAFSEVLSRNPDVRLLYNHDDAAVMARTKSGTLELAEDDIGLRIWARVDMSDTDVQRVVPKMIRADVDQMSFAFTVEEDDWDESGGYPLRTIRSIGELFEVSIVPFPAYEATKAEVYERARSTGRVLVARATPTVAGISPGGSESQVVDLGMGRSRSDEGRIRAAKWRARLSHHKLNIKR